MRDTPTDITLKQAERILEITWGDEVLHRHSVRQLRCECPCARCVDERTGVRTLDVEAVPDNIGITNMELVGRYAVKLVFSDGHNTGLYSWDLLYRMESVR